jgi:hypothetical protein
MARYKDYCYEQGKMIPISFREQILPGLSEFLCARRFHFTRQSV